VALLEDTISTGESALVAARALRSAGAAVTRCVCIFTWGWGATRAAFDAEDLPLEPLATLADLLAVAAAEGSAGAEERAVIERWAADPHGWQG
jgi:orotate phosphoribosyltransferase